MTLLAQSDRRLSKLALNQIDWHSIIEDSHTALFVGEVEDQVIGFILGRIQDGNGLMMSLVLDAHRYYGGAGRKLWQALQTWFDTEGASEIYLYVPRNQAVTQAFWHALGAKAIATNKYPNTIEIPPAGIIWMTF